VRYVEVRAVIIIAFKISNGCVRKAGAPLTIDQEVLTSGVLLKRRLKEGRKAFSESRAVGGLFMAIEGVRRRGTLRKLVLKFTFFIETIWSRRLDEFWVPSRKLAPSGVTLRAIMHFFISKLLMIAYNYLGVFNIAYYRT
jgi:hypothetical protein